MSKKIALLLFIILLALTSCASAAEAPQEAPAAEPAFESAPGAPSFAGEGERDMAREEASTGSTVSDGERLVIRNANLSIVVNDPGQALSTVSRMAENMGGFVVTSYLYKTTSQGGMEIPEANITVRVPAERLNEALDQIKALVEDPEQDVLSENISGQDVTKEYTDLNSRLVNLEESEKQLREIMASATRTEDVLAVQQELTRVRGEIEVLQGQIQYYEEAAALSAISVLIRAQEAVEPLEIGGWQPVGVARNAIQALIDALQFIGSAAIWLALFLLPIALVIGLPIYLLVRLIRRNNKGGKKPLAAPPANPQS